LHIPQVVPENDFSSISLSGYNSMGQLTDLRVKNAEHCAKEYLLADGDGLYLRVRQTRKVWLYRYMHDGKNIKLTLGRYPVVSLAATRRKAREEMERRADGIDPKEARREQHRGALLCS
jgi:hypothetical protein